MNQLTLPIALHDDATFANYYPGPNQNCINYLQSFISGHEDRIVFLSGQSGSGCSHLLQACCHDVLSMQLSAAYINFNQSQLKPDILENLEYLYLICLDEIHEIVGSPLWEEGLFHLFNRVLASKSLLIFSAPLEPQLLPIKLADLASRLTSLLCLNLSNLKDEEIMIALQLRAAKRGFLITPEVGQFLLRRYPRNMSALFLALEQLDKASLVAKRKLTIPFVKEVLSL